MLRSRVWKKNAELRALSVGADLLAAEDGRGALIRRFRHAAKGHHDLERESSALLLSGSLLGHAREEGTADIGELMAIVESGVVHGSSIRRSLELFMERVEERVRRANRFRSKAGAPVALIYMGMGVFFPLFSGISAVILSGSLGYSAGVTSLTRGFLGVAMLYMATILYLSSAFAHPERKVARNIAAVLPYLGLGSAIMLTSHTFLSGIL